MRFGLAPATRTRERPGVASPYRSPIAVAVAAAVCSFAGASNAQDGAPVREYIVDEGKPPASAQWKVIAGGLGATAAFYGLAQPFSYGWSDSPGMKELRYPVVGPWMALANDKCSASDPDCSTLWLVARGVLEVIDGLGQAGGLAIALEGLFLTTTPDKAVSPAPGQPRKKTPAPQPTESPLTPGTPGNLFYLPRPMPVGQQGIGLGVIGVF